MTATETGKQHEDRQRGSSSSPLPSPSVSVASDDSDETEWAGAERGGRNTIGEADSQAYRGRSASMSTRASREAVSGRGGDAYESGDSANGFELCPSCIEIHGISHAKAAVAANRRARADPAAHGVRAGSEMRHCFREKLWGLEGWTDIGKSSGRMVPFWAKKTDGTEYNEDVECTICQTRMLYDRYKCVSCTKFDLCQGCKCQILQR